MIRGLSGVKLFAKDVEYLFTTPSRDFISQIAGFRKALDHYEGEKTTYIGGNRK
ncbi:hypothetical protein KKC1_31010 [Calderihabitans maritimus]|uniref:Uncharacterized protein n=1 Tax=Calderihabitans maritimus TaxID=1246530 RepID=A0A1Z5HXC1_9FIRM|nr:hypothetical protein KKC1_31010 [Calderihabitans maritimus]